MVGASRRAGDGERVSIFPANEELRFTSFGDGEKKSSGRPFVAAPGEEDRQAGGGCTIPTHCCHGREPCHSTGAQEEKAGDVPGLTWDAQGCFDMLVAVPLGRNGRQQGLTPLQPPSWPCREGQPKIPSVCGPHMQHPLSLEGHPVPSRHKEALRCSATQGPRCPSLVAAFPVDTARPAPSAQVGAPFTASLNALLAISLPPLSSVRGQPSAFQRRTSGVQRAGGRRPPPCAPAIRRPRAPAPALLR